MKKWKRKLIFARERFTNKLKDKSGQGAVDTAIICEPFLECRRW